MVVLKHPHTLPGDDGRVEFGGYAKGMLHVAYALFQWDTYERNECPLYKTLYVLSEKDRCLRIVVVAFARPIPTLAV
jgi:hypothetical protein